MTLCSPDPKAFRPPDEKPNVLQVGLPTNFKAAKFDSDDYAAMLCQIESDIERARLDAGDGATQLPVKLKVHDSIFVPLAKWNMLLTGNYRCIQKDGMRFINEAVHSDIELSRSVYNWVGELCRALGATENDQVPFAAYASAARGLLSRRRQREPCLAVLPTSKEWTDWCRASRRPRVCVPIPSTRWSRSSMPHWISIGEQPEGTHAGQARNDCSRRNLRRLRPQGFGGT
jgi:hypothetical protein